MNRDLFWRYLEPEHPRMEAFCRKLAGNRDDGDDLYQDALLTAMARIGTLAQPDSFKPWLYRIIVNKYKSRRRREWIRNRLLRSYPGTEVADSNEEGRLTARIWLEKAFKAVSAGERALITLFEIEGWSVSEISAMMSKSEGTIKSQLSRARKKMRVELKKYLSKSKQMKVETKYALPRCKTSAE